MSYSQNIHQNRLSPLNCYFLSCPLQNQSTKWWLIILLMQELGITTTTPPSPAISNFLVVCQNEKKNEREREKESDRVIETDRQTEGWIQFKMRRVPI